MSFLLSQVFETTFLVVWFD